MSEAPWWAAFGEPKAQAPAIEAHVVATQLAAQPLGPNTKRDFLLVDVRRTDYEGGTVTTSINFPAHSFYQTRAIIYQLCKQAGIKQIIFYCST
jgi:arsenical-resistance protein 2